MKIVIDNVEYLPYETECCHLFVIELEHDQVNITFQNYICSFSRPVAENINIDFPTIKVPSKTIFESINDKPVFLFTYKKEKTIKSNYNYYFENGKVYRSDIILKSNDKVYIEGGAVLQAHFFAENAENIEISGRGIVDTSEVGAKKHRTMLFHNSNNIKINDISIIGAVDWSLITVGCNNVDINNINIVTWEVNGDGLDIVGTNNYSATGCFMRCADDCVSVKATDYDFSSGCQNCNNIKISDCIMWNAKPGNAMEIGFETRCNEISNVIFENNTVLHCEYEGWMSGGVLTIHNGDRAKIHDIIYRNITIEDASQKLIDFKNLRARYSVDKQLGFIENILIENIYFLGEELPPSVFSDYDNGMRIKNIKIKNLNHRDKKINTKLSAHFITESGSDVEFI